MPVDDIGDFFVNSYPFAFRYSFRCNNCTFPDYSCSFCSFLLITCCFFINCWSVLQLKKRNSITVMPLPYSMFYLSWDQAVLWAYPTPSTPSRLDGLLGSPTFMRYLPFKRNHILPRVSCIVHLAVYSYTVAGFTPFDRLTNTNSLTRLNCSSFQSRLPMNSNRFVSSPTLISALA